MKAEKLTINMLNLSEDCMAIVNANPLDKIVLSIRAGWFPTNIQITNACRSARRAGTRFYRGSYHTRKAWHDEATAELERLGLIRHDTEKLQLTANIVEVYRMAKSTRWGKPSVDPDTEGYIPKLINKMGNYAYENWDGFDDETIKAIKAFLKRTLSDKDYQVIVLRFGLEDGKCVERAEVAKLYGWTDSGVRYHERSAAEKLYNVIDELEALIKIPLS